MSTTTERHPDWINPDLDLTGVNDNAFAILGTVNRALRRAGNSDAVIEAYKEAAKSGDYNHLLTVSMLYAGMMD